MPSWRLITRLATIYVLGLSICACANRYSQDSNVQGEGNQRLQQAALDVQELDEQGIELTPQANVLDDAKVHASDVQIKVWRSDPDLIKHLHEYISNVHRILQMAHHHGIKLDSATILLYGRSAEIARRYLDLLER